MRCAQKKQVRLFRERILCALREHWPVLEEVVRGHAWPLAEALVRLNALIVEVARRRRTCHAVLAAVVIVGLHDEERRMGCPAAALTSRRLVRVPGACVKKMMSKW